MEVYYPFEHGCMSLSEAATLGLVTLVTDYLGLVTSIKLLDSRLVIRRVMK